MLARVSQGELEQQEGSGDRGGRMLESGYSWDVVEPVLLEN